MYYKIHIIKITLQITFYNINGSLSVPKGKSGQNVDKADKNAKKGGEFDKNVSILTKCALSTPTSPQHRPKKMSF